jgi:DNA-binding NarL/FixJ family response regulator
MNRPPGCKARVMLVEDHVIVRQGMAMLINAQADMEVCDEASGVDEALRKIRRENLPDIVLIDISLEGLSGLELIKNLKVRFPSLPTLAVSMHDETLYAERALRAGAMGYIMKQAAAHTMLVAIRDILAGKIHLSAHMQNLFLSSIMNGRAEELPACARLTPAEFEIMHMIGSGYSSQQIAAMLNRSIKTIEAHRANIRNKLGLKDGAELIRFATRWLESPPAKTMT